MQRRGVVLRAWVALALGGCAAAAPTLQTGPDAEVTYDGLTRVDNTTMDAVWVRHDIDLSGYSKIMLEGAEVEFRPAKAGVGRDGPFPLSAAQRQRVVETIRDAFVEELASGSRFALTSEPGPDVLLVRGALLDIVSNVPPSTGLRSEVYLSSLGEVTLVLEVRDALSEAILARAVDRAAAGDMAGRLTRAGTASSWAEVKQVALRWGQQLRRGLESLAPPPK